MTEVPPVVPAVLRASRGRSCYREVMRTLPLLIPTPDTAALLPFERRRIPLVDEKMATAVRLAWNSGRELVFQAHETASRQLLYVQPDGEQLLPIGTRCRIVEASFEGEDGYAILRGLQRIEVETEGPETSFHALPPVEGSEADFQAACERLGSLDLLPSLKGGPLEERIDRLAIWLALPAWVQGEVLCLRELDKRLARILDHAKELASPGGSFRPDDLETAWASAEDHLADRVSLFGSRAKAEGGSTRGRSRRSATLRHRATAARLRHRRLASEREGAMPALEKLIADHDLPNGAIDALLVAGLGCHPRFGLSVTAASRLLPPGELPLNVWIAALEAGIFAQAQ